MDRLPRRMDHDGVRGGAAVPGTPLAAVGMVPETPVQFEVFTAIR